MISKKEHNISASIAHVVICFAFCMRFVGASELQFCSKAAALIKAARDGDAEAVTSLVCHIDLFEKEKVGQEALNEAIYNERERVVEVLMNARVSSNISKLEGNIWHPLAHAAFLGNVSIVQTLLTSGADPSGKSDGTPLIAAVHGKKNNYEVAKLLLQAGASPNTMLDNGLPRTALIAAAKLGKGRLVDLLLKHDVYGDQIQDAILVATKNLHQDITKQIFRSIVKKVSASCATKFTWKKPKDHLRYFVYQVKKFVSDTSFSFSEVQFLYGSSIIEGVITQRDLLGMQLLFDFGFSPSAALYFFARKGWHAGIPLALGYSMDPDRDVNFQLSGTLPARFAELTPLKTTVRYGYIDMFKELLDVGAQTTNVSGKSSDVVGEIIDMRTLGTQEESGPPKRAADVALEALLYLAQLGQITGEQYKRLACIESGKYDEVPYRRSPYMNKIIEDNLIKEDYLKRVSMRAFDGVIARVKELLIARKNTLIESFPDFIGPDVRDIILQFDEQAKVD